MMEYFISKEIRSDPHMRDFGVFRFLSHAATVIVILFPFLFVNMSFAAGVDRRAGSTPATSSGMRIRENEMDSNASVVQLQGKLEGSLFQRVYSPYVYVGRGQLDIPLVVSVQNQASSAVLIQNIMPVFSAVSSGDRQGDYVVGGDTAPNVIILPGEEYDFSFSIDVSSDALINTDIRIDAAILATDFSSYEDFADTTTEEAHHWTVLDQAINVVCALYDTRLTPERYDDSLVCQVIEEVFPLNTDYYLNNSNPIGEIVMDGRTLYRLVVQVNPTSDWDYEPNGVLNGYFAVWGKARSFGRFDSQNWGVKELLLTNSVIPDMEVDPVDLLVGCTMNFFPPQKWDMTSDPFFNPVIDFERLGEFGSVVLAGDTIGYMVSCQDGDEGWEITSQCESERYYFYELWFAPDFEWSHKDTVDMLLYIRGKPYPNDIDKLHMIFNVVDDDVDPPQFSEFYPQMVSEGEQLYVICKITDESGVYDSDMGSSSQGVYVKWDVDGELENDYHEDFMSEMNDGYYITDCSIGTFVEGTEITYQVCACDNDTDGGISSDRTCGCSEIQTVRVVGYVYVVDDSSSLFPWRVYRGQENVFFHIDISNISSYGLWLHTSSTLNIVSGSDTVSTSLANETWIASGASNFTLSFAPVDIPWTVNTPDSVRIVLDFHGQDEYGQSFTQSWTVSESNTLYLLEPTLHFIAHAVPGSIVHPAEKQVPVLLLEVINDSPFDATIDSFAVTNAIVGSATPPLTDKEFGPLYLYRTFKGNANLGEGIEDKGRTVYKTSRLQLVRDRRITFSQEGSLKYPSYISRLVQKNEDVSAELLTSTDSLIAVSRMDNGKCWFELTKANQIPPQNSCFFFFTADIDSFYACDGDSLDIEIPGEEDVVIHGPQSKLFHEHPLNSPGTNPVDGFMSFQMKIEQPSVDTVFSGDTLQPIFSAVVPVNGYLPDILTGLSIKDFAGSNADSYVSNLKVWIDNGDGVFECTSDSLIGHLQFTGEYFQSSGLYYVLSSASRIYITADIVEDFSSNAELMFGVPGDGVEYASGNDGPIDNYVLPSSFITVVRREYVQISPIDIEQDEVYPGDSEVELLAFELENKTLGSIWLDSILVTPDSTLNDCSFVSNFKLYCDNGDYSFDSSMDTLLSEGVITQGKINFGNLNSKLSPSIKKGYFVVADLDSFMTPDGLRLNFGIIKGEDIGLNSESAAFPEIVGDFPVNSEGLGMTDGMMSFQVLLRYPEDSTIVNKKSNIEVLAFGVPSNGCLDDTLTALTVVNYGTAGIEHILSMSLWRDDGDRVFDPFEDDSIAVLNSVDYSTFEVSGISVPLPGGAGEYFFVTVNLRETIESGGTISVGIPKMGIEVASGNDGPIDRDLIPQSSLIIPVPDRITFFASIVGNKRVRPGDRNVLNMVIGAYNSYMVPKVIKSIALLNVGSIKENEITEVLAFTDFNGDGLFNPEDDSLVVVATPYENGYLLENLNLSLGPFENTVLFISYSTVVHGIRDSVKVDFQVSDRSSIEFIDEAPNIQGDFPLNSAGVDITDGMVSDQVTVIASGSRRVSPGDKNVLCLSLDIPSNGSSKDILEGFRVMNRGSAEATSDIEYLKLWKESSGSLGDFNPAEDIFVDFLGWDGDGWRTVSTLSDTIPLEGLPLYVTADIAGSAVDGRTLEISVPINGIQVVSGNDGPIDKELRSKDRVTITTDPLFSSMVAPERVTVGQEFDVLLKVSNAADTSLHFVVPDSFSIEGSGVVTLTNGPVPQRIDEFEGQTDSAFVWRMRAESSGYVVFSGKAKEEGGEEASILSSTDSVVIEKSPENFSAEFADLAPVSVNRGKSNVQIFMLKLRYLPPGGEGAGVLFSSLRVRFVNEAGLPIPVNTIASSLRIEDEIKTIGIRDVTGLSDSEVDIYSQEPLLINPGDSTYINFSITIPADASAGDFRIYVDSPSWIYLQDGNGAGEVVPGGFSYPWYTNDVTLRDPATALTLKAQRELPAMVNKGQEDIKALTLSLENNNGPSSANISVSEIRFRFINSSRDTLIAEDVVDYFAITNDAGTIYFSTSSLNTKELICKFNPSLSVSAGIPLNLHVLIDCAKSPEDTVFALVITDSTFIDARDANSGQVVEIIPDSLPGGSFPIFSGYSSILNPADSANVEAHPGLPAVSIVGANNVEALSLVLSHNGDEDESPIRCDGFRLRLINERGEGIKPADIISAIRVVSGTSNIATIFITEEVKPLIVVPFDASLLIKPGMSETLSVYLDISPQARTGYFQFHISSNDIGFFDSTDGHLITNVGGTFPLTSGLCRIVEPTGSIAFDAISMVEDNVSAGSRTAIFRFVFSLDGSTSVSGVLVDGVALEIIGLDGRVIDPSRLIEDVSIEWESKEVAIDWQDTDGKLSVYFADSVVVNPDERIEGVLYLTLLDKPDVDVFAVKVASPEDIQCYDLVTSSPVAVESLEGSSFPFVSGKVTILLRDLSASFANYPNPFIAGREKSRITFYLPVDASVTLRVFTLDGKSVKTLVERRFMQKGLYQDYYWDGRNGRGRFVLNGVYYLVLDVEAAGRSYRLKRKVAVVR